MPVEVKSSPYAAGRPDARLPALVGKGTEPEEKADSGYGTGKKAGRTPASALSQGKHAHGTEATSEAC